MIDRDALQEIVSNQGKDRLTTVKGHTVSWILPITDDSDSRNYPDYVAALIEPGEKANRIYIYYSDGTSDLEGTELILKEEKPDPVIYHLEGFIPVYKTPDESIYLGMSAPTKSRAIARETYASELIAVLPANITFKEGDGLNHDDS